MRLPSFFGEKIFFKKTLEVSLQPHTFISLNHTGGKAAHNRTKKWLTKPLAPNPK